MNRTTLALTLSALATAPALAITPIQIDGGPVDGTLESGETEFIPEDNYRSAPSYNRDIYSFDASAGDQVIVHLNCEFDGYLYLYDPNGNEVASNDDYGGLYQSHIDTALSSGGTHHIVVTTFSPGATGSYDIELMSAAGAAAAAAANATDDTSISVGETVQGNLSAGASAALPGDYRGDSSFNRDGYTFSGNAGDSVTIHVDAQYDAYLFLVGPSGTVIASNDDHTGLYDCHIETTLPSAGDYRVVVSSFSPGATGSYTLSLSGAGGSSTGPASAPAASMPTSAPTM